MGGKRGQRFKIQIRRNGLWAIVVGKIVQKRKSLLKRRAVYGSRYPSSPD
jgi:hypothetical protein